MALMVPSKSHTHMGNQKKVVMGLRNLWWIVNKFLRFSRSFINVNQLDQLGKFQVPSNNFSKQNTSPDMAFQHNYLTLC